MERYYVYRYRYREMLRPRWDASPVKDGVDILPPTILSDPGILIIEARNRRIAKAMGRRSRLVCPPYQHPC